MFVSSHPSLFSFHPPPPLPPSPCGLFLLTSSTFTTPQRRPVKFTPRLSSTPSSSPHPPPRPHPSPSPFSLTKRVKREHPSPPPPSPPPQPHWDDSTANDDWDGEMGDDDGGFQDNEPTIAEETEKPDVYVN